MVNKRITLSLDSKTYEEFQKYCRANAIMLSKKIELWMREFLGENLDEKRRKNNVEMRK